MALADSRAAGGPRVWEVAALVHAVADALAARFAAVAVRGEISGWARAASGHCYFTLKDAEHTAALRCAMFRRAAQLCDFAPEEGDLVELRGRLAVYEPRGELQFVVESMRRSGAGALFERFLRLKSQLEAEGLFDAARKRPIPAFPRRVGIVTSLAAAAKSASVTSVSWPMPATTGIGEAAIARTTTASLKAHRSSIEPPPRQTIRVSTSARAPARAIASARACGASPPCTGLG